MPPSPVVELEDRIGSQLLLAQLGVGPVPHLEPRYDVIELRGRGARGVVCRARDRTLARDVALKLYPPLTDAQLPKEVAREAQALARLDHPNVVRVHDVGAAALVAGTDRLACLYLSMEFIEGRSLRAWRSERRRPRAEILRVLLAAGEGLAAAHDGGMIHRDFKPENVMLDARGRVRIVDFGLARGIQTGFVWSSSSTAPAMQDALDERLTRVGTVPGTLEYMAPEALQGQTDARSDQFSFAATAWESLAGELPFDVHRVMRAAPGAPLVLQGGAALPPRMRAVLERAMAPAPERRWPSMHALLRALRWANAARRRIVLGVTGLAVSGAIGVGVAMSMQAQREATDALGPSPTDRAACQQVMGQWSLHTVVGWAHDSFDLYDVNGYYELQLEPLGGCAARLHVRKTGDSVGGQYSPLRIREAEAAVVLSPGPAGLQLSTDLDLASDAKARQRYHFELYLSDDTLRGDWRQLDSRGRVHKKGRLAGGRAVPTDPVTPGTRGLPCASQCRVLCSSDLATLRCTAGACTGAEPAVVEGCTPDTDFVAPSLVVTNLSTPVEYLRVFTDLEAEAPTRCARAATALVGTWRVWEHGNDEPWTLVLSASAMGGPCALAASLAASGRRKRRLETLVTPAGAWVLVDEPTEAGEPPTVGWSLIGWNPAYGLAANGSALSAHKLEAGPEL